MQKKAALSAKLALDSMNAKAWWPAYATMSKPEVTRHVRPYTLRLHCTFRRLSSAPEEAQA